MNDKKLKENFIKKVNEKYDNKIKVEDFIDRLHVATFKCNNNHTFKMLARKILERKLNTCPECEKYEFNKNQEKKIKEIFKNEYTLLSKYIKNNEYIKVRHNKCGFIYQVTPNNIFGGKKCPNCSNKKPQRDTEWFKNKINEMYKDEYSLLSEYIKTNTKVEIKHNKCGNVFKMSPNNFIHGQKCPKCQHPHSKKGNQEFIKEFNELFKNDFILLSEYKTNKIKVTIKCLKCGKISNVTPIKLLRKNKYIYKCSCITQSNAEKFINDYLQKNKINFERQKKFENCKDKRSLPFDFYLKDFNILIEYDGEQHFYPIYGKNRLEKCQLHDKIKNKWCNENNIKLIRFNFKDNLEIEMNELVQRLSKPHNYNYGRE